MAAMVGLVMLPPGAARMRIGLFFGVILAASCAGLVRLHATGGYATARHGLIPGTLLLMSAAHGLNSLAAGLAIPGAWLRMGQERFRPGPAVWTVLLTCLIVAPRLQQAAYSIPGPYNVYRDTGTWLAEHTAASEQVLDMTDWALYFSGRSGRRFAQVYEAPADPRLRWVVVREPHLKGHWNYARIVNELVGGRAPAFAIPSRPEPGQLQVLIYDRLGLYGSLAGTPGLPIDAQAHPTVRK
jgi:hypothetical protein